MSARFRCEADHYGYGWWLARHLGYNFNPISLRGFQHGWIWWKSSDCDYKIGLDPNLNEFFGVLVQDEEVKNYLIERGIFAKTCGLPFLNFYRHYDLRGGFTSGREGKVLFVPAHSNPWNDYSKVISNSIQNFKEAYGEISVLLGSEDYKLFKSHNDERVHFIEGAGVTDPASFYRMAKCFESHEYVITDSVGSHICYALHCGAKVGIEKRLYQISQKIQLSLDTPDNKNITQLPDYEKFLTVRSLDYLESQFPKITINGDLPKYNIPPNIAYEKPHVIASELGWDITYPSEMYKSP